MIILAIFENADCTNMENTSFAK